MFRTPPSSAPSPPCRIRRRNALVSSVYHSSPLFNSLIATLDDGLNRHNPCPCHSCLATRRSKRTSVQPHDAPPSKRARTKYPAFSSFTSPEPPVVTRCQWCAFSDHPSRQTCRQCARRRAPPPMVQRLNAERMDPPDSSENTTSDVDSQPVTSPFSDADTISFVREHLMEYPYTAFADHQADPAGHCADYYTPPYQSHSLEEFHVPLSVPPPVSVPQVVPHVQSAGLQYASPRSTIPDPSHLTDVDSVCSPESPSMESKSVEHVHKHTYSHSQQIYPNEAELDVDKLIEEVSNEISEQSNVLKALDSARMSLVSSPLSDFTRESVVELNRSDEAYGPSKTMDDQKALPDENPADIFLSEIIMSEDEHDSGACNDIADLSFTLLDGMFPCLQEQDVC